MQQLRLDAEAASGVPYSAVIAARAACLYDRLGLEAFKQLSTSFYARVYADVGWFRDIFANTTRDAAIRNQYEFLVEQFGGPPLYSDRKGHVALLGRHAPYPVTTRAARRWLEHMRAALEETNAIDEAASESMMGYFRHMASFVVCGRQLVNPARTVGYFGKHDGGKGS